MKTIQLSHQDGMQPLTAYTQMTSIPMPSLYATVVTSPIQKEGVINEPKLSLVKMQVFLQMQNASLKDPRCLDKSDINFKAAQTG